jgi:hypothetical protein
MADVIVDGMTRVYYVPTIANPSAPTVAELNAGTNLTSTLTAAGLEGFEASPGEVDNTALSSTFDTKLPGVSSFSGTRLILKKQATGDTVFTLMTAFNTAGYIVIRRNVLQATAWTIGQVAQVYPINTGQFDYLAPERNTVTRYWVAVPISAAPTYTAVVA